MAEGKRYFWLKLKEDFFQSKRIKKLRHMAGGDTYTIIYLKMQLLALRSDGVLTWTGLEDNFADELALDLDEKPEDVEVTLLYLLKTGLAETQDNISFTLPWVLENTGSENASAQRVREFRERQKALQCNAGVTQVKRIGNVEKEIEIDKEKEIEIEEPQKPKEPAVGLEVVKAWNSMSEEKGLSQVTKLMPGTERYNLLKKRIADYGVDGVLRAIENVRNSPFLLGENNRGWQVTFDWMIKPNNFPKVLDGNYLDKGKPAKQYMTAEQYAKQERKVLSPDELWSLADSI